MLNNKTYKELIDFLEEYKKADYKTVKKKMRYYRKQKGITPEFFEKNGLFTVGALKTLEKLSYKYKPSLESLIKYCYALGIKLEDILEKPE